MVSCLEASCGPKKIQNKRCVEAWSSLADQAKPRCNRPGMNRGGRGWGTKIYWSTDKHTQRNCDCCPWIHSLLLRKKTWWKISENMWVKSVCLWFSSPIWNMFKLKKAEQSSLFSPNLAVFALIWMHYIHIGLPQFSFNQTISSI